MCLKTADLIELQASKIFIRQPEKKRWKLLDEISGKIWISGQGRRLEEISCLHLQTFWVPKEYYKDMFCFISCPRIGHGYFKALPQWNSELVIKVPHMYVFEDRWFNWTTGFKDFYSSAWKKRWKLLDEISGKIWSSGQGRLQRAYRFGSSHCLSSKQSVTFNIDNQYVPCTWIHLQRIAFVWWECRLIKRGRCTAVCLYCWLVHQEEGRELEMKLALLLITIWMENTRTNFVILYPVWFLHDEK